MNGLGKADFGTMKSGQVQPRFAFDVFPDDRLFGHRRFHRLFDDQLVDFHQLGGVFDHARLGVADVALTGKFLERVLDGGPAR